MESQKLLNRLRQLGINLLPVVEDALCAKTNHKIDELQN